MLALLKGRYSARLAAGSRDVDRAQALRHLCFRTARGLPGRADGRDSDTYDAQSQHVLIEDQDSGALLCCFRLLPLTSGAMLDHSYAAQFYDLTALAAFAGPMTELGRFCIHPDRQDPDILRVAWGAITRHVDECGVQMLFGCSSFQGAEVARHRDALALLKDRHLAPPVWRPEPKAAQVVPFARLLAGAVPDGRRAAQTMPPLLRTYLLMGGWVSDHAVRDPDLDTLHVFTGLEIAAIPPARARLLREVAR